MNRSLLKDFIAAYMSWLAGKCEKMAFGGMTSECSCLATCGHFAIFGIVTEWPLVSSHVSTLEIEKQSQPILAMSLEPFSPPHAVSDLHD